MDFDDYFLDIAKAVATKSKDSTKVGCVIVGEDNQILTSGWNGFSRGVSETPDRMERPSKYDWTIHAEANAICNAARSGTALKNGTAYVTHMPCKNCIDFIIQAGIKCVVVEDGGTFNDPAIYNFDITMQKILETDIELRKVSKNNDDKY